MALREQLFDANSMAVDDADESFLLSTMAVDDNDQQDAALQFLLSAIMDDDSDDEMSSFSSDDDGNASLDDTNGDEMMSSEDEGNASLDDTNGDEIIRSVVAEYNNRGEEFLLSFFADDEIATSDAPQQSCASVVYGSLEYRNLDAASDKVEECPICLDQFGEQVQIGEFSCSHIFHQHCISRWLQLRRTCPLCRLKLWPPPS